VNDHIQKLPQREKVGLFLRMAIRHLGASADVVGVNVAQAFCDGQLNDHLTSAAMSAAAQALEFANTEEALAATNDAYASMCVGDSASIRDRDAAEQARRNSTGALALATACTLIHNPNCEIPQIADTEFTDELERLVAKLA
jgi:hypothetical protein